MFINLVFFQIGSCRTKVQLVWYSDTCLLGWSWMWMPIAIQRRGGWGWPGHARWWGRPALLKTEGDVVESDHGDAHQKVPFLPILPCALVYVCAHLVLFQPSIGYLGDCFDTCFPQMTCKSWLIIGYGIMETPCWHVIKHSLLFWRMTSFCWLQFDEQKDRAAGGPA
jgi:hypothetical protein